MHYSRAPVQKNVSLNYSLQSTAGSIQKMRSVPAEPDSPAKYFAGFRFKSSEAGTGLIILCLALFSAELSFSLRETELNQNIAFALGILSGQSHSHPEIQNRILFPLLLASIHWFGHGLINLGQAWRGARFSAAVISYLGTYLALRRITRDTRLALIGIILISYCYVWTAMGFGWERGEDFFDILFSALFVACAVQRNYVWMIFVVLLAACNRESAMFGGIVWACVAGARHKFSFRAFKDYGFGGLCVVIAGLVVYGLRAALGHGNALSQYLGIAYDFVHWKWLFMPFGAISKILAMVIPLAWIAQKRCSPLPDESVGLFWAALVCGVITAIFGILGELRIWLPCIVFIVIAISLGLREPEVVRIRPGIAP